jgi:thymidylate synthase
MKQYHNLLSDIRNTGELKPAARAGMPNTLALFGTQTRYKIDEDGFPLLTTKRVSFKNIKTELIWFLDGNTNVDFLLKNKNGIWLDDVYRGYINKMRLDPQNNMMSKEGYREMVLTNEEFADDYGSLGETYGFQWRNFAGEIDQILNVIHSLKTQPFGRRHIVTAWDPRVVDKLTLPPCHPFFQFGVRKGVNKAYKLDCHFFMRSVDTFLGMPYNIASYALLTAIIAKIVDMEVGHVILSASDTHIYDNHYEAVDEILTRDSELYALPTLNLSGPFDCVNMYWGERSKMFALDSFITDIKSDLNCIEVKGYKSYPELKAPLSVGL